MGKTKIQWTEKTWNPIHGCTPISPGCDNCYAERMARRLAGMPRNSYHKNGHFIPTFDFKNPPRAGMVFVCSMGDLFHKTISTSQIEYVFNAMIENPGATFQVLTKRPERMRYIMRFLKPIPNVWLGISVENLEWYYKRWPHIGAFEEWPVRFVSFEPLLGISPFFDMSFCPGWPDWVIIGGETGPNARECKLEWIESIIDECRNVDTPIFVKQLGTYTARKMGLKSRTGADPDEWPSHIRYRQYPK